MIVNETNMANSKRHLEYSTKHDNAKHINSNRHDANVTSTIFGCVSLMDAESVATATTSLTASSMLKVPRLIGAPAWVMYVLCAFMNANSYTYVRTYKGQQNFNVISRESRIKSMIKA